MCEICQNKVKRCNGSTSDKFLHLLTVANFQVQFNLSQKMYYCN